MTTVSAIYPVITLYQPWATWIMRGWKIIETRTHDRFRCLEDKMILIHAGMKTDDSAAAINNPYLLQSQIMESPDEMVNGYILGKAFVYNFCELQSGHSRKALIDCGTVKRFGLFLSGIDKFPEPIPCKGEMGIWYYDLNNKQKAKKHQSQPELF